MFTSPDLMIGEGDPEALLSEPIRAVNARRVVIDSLSHLSMYSKDEDVRQQTYQIVNFFKQKGISTSLIWEFPQTLGQSFSVSELGLSFLVDAIVALKFVEIESSIRRAVVVLKMRGSDHDKSLREYQVTKDSIEVQAPSTQYQGIMSGSPVHLPAEVCRHITQSREKGKIEEKGDLVTDPKWLIRSS